MRAEAVAAKGVAAATVAARVEAAPAVREEREAWVCLVAEVVAKMVVRADREA